MKPHADAAADADHIDEQSGRTACRRHVPVEHLVSIEQIGTVDEQDR